jgi:hypothetical protein
MRSVSGTPRGFGSPARTQILTLAAMPSDETTNNMGQTRIMFIENKDGESNLTGDARIGRVTFSKTGKSIHYNGQTFERIRGFKANYRDIETGDSYWISGCKENGEDMLYGERLPILIDEDVREEYWTNIRNSPENQHLTRIN